MINSRFIIKTGLVMMMASLFICAATGKSRADIRLFGASLIDASRNAAAIERAMAAADSIYIPQGIWRVDRPIMVTANKKVFFGDGESSVIMTQDPGDIIVLQPHLHNISIERLHLKGMGDKRKASYLLYGKDHVSNIKISHCTFDGGTGGILIDYESRNIHVSHCTFRNMVYIPGAGAATGGNHKAGGAGGYGVVFQQHAPTSDMPHGGRGVIKGSITDCTFEATVIRHATYIQSSESITISHNTIYGTDSYNDSQAMQDLLTTGLTEQQIDGLDVRRHTTIYDYALEFRGGRDITVSGNNVSGGIGFINGTTDKEGHKGRNFRIENNKVSNINLSHGQDHTNLWYVESPLLKGNTISASRTP